VKRKNVEKSPKKTERDRQDKAEKNVFNSGDGSRFTTNGKDLSSGGASIKYCRGGRGRKRSDGNAWKKVAVDLPVEPNF